MSTDPARVVTGREASRQGAVMSADIDLQTVPVGATVQVRALKLIVIGKRNRTAVRKGDITTAVRLKDNGIVALYQLQATVSGVGNPCVIHRDIEAVPSSCPPTEPGDVSNTGGGVT